MIVLEVHRTWFGFMVSKFAYVSAFLKLTNLADVDVRALRVNVGVVREEGARGDVRTTSDRRAEVTARDDVNRLAVLARDTEAKGLAVEGTTVKPFQVPSTNEMGYLSFSKVAAVRVDLRVHVGDLEPKDSYCEFKIYQTQCNSDSRRRIVRCRDRITGVEQLHRVVASAVGDSLGSSTVKEWNCHGGEDYELGEHRSGLKLVERVGWYSCK